VNETRPKRFDEFRIFLLALAACSIATPVILLNARHELAAVLSVIVAFAIWTFIGRKFFRSGFYLFFDFLSMQVFLAGFIVIGIAVCRWWAA
jgi:hypothetical protein